MRPLLLTLVLAVATPALAAPITWQSSGTVNHVSDPLNLWPGLTVGTPWSLALTFDPSTPGEFLPGGSAGSPCYKYATGAATLTLGGHTYSQSASGQDGVYTNFQFPEAGCTGQALPSEPGGLVSFLFIGPWTQEPGAWNLNNGFPAFLVASYYDLLATDGSLPGVPTINPNPGRFGGLQVEAAGLGSQFTAGFQPALTAVPEPATMMLFAAGLGGLVARRRRLLPRR